MRVLCERNLECNNKVCVCFVDYEKAFDWIDWVKLLDILGNVGVSWRDQRLFGISTWVSQHMCGLMMVFRRHARLVEV